MANRQTDSTIWKSQKWFKRLPVLYKLAWRYLTDQCNHAGIWKIDISELLDDLGVEKFDFFDFLAACNRDFDKKSGKEITRNRIYNFHEDYVWLTGFMTFQYSGKTGVIKSENLAVKSAFEMLKSYGLFDKGIEHGFFTINDHFNQNNDTPYNPHEAPLSPSNPVQPSSSPLSHLRAKARSPSPISTRKGKPPPSPLKPLEGVNERERERDSNTESIQPLNFNKLNTQKKSFNTNPKIGDFNGLPEQYVLTSIQLLKFRGQKIVEKNTVLEMWEIFKVQNLTGQEYYANEGKVYRHFQNWIKNEKFTDATATTPAAGVSGNKFSAGAEKLLAKGKEIYAASGRKPDH